MKQIEVIKVDGDTVEIWQHEDGKFTAVYVYFGVRFTGTLLEVMQDIHDVYGIFD